MIPGTSIAEYLSRITKAAHEVEMTDANGYHQDPRDFVPWLVKRARLTHDARGRLIFVGNGGSASIASHMAIDWGKNGGFRSLAFNDAPALTCLGNDLGYENVFAKQIQMHGRREDLLIAISSSGRSPNILRAVEAMRDAHGTVLTLSGFDADNPLRRLGDRNLYVPAREYGHVEISHLGALHCALDRVIELHECAASLTV